MYMVVYDNDWENNSLHDTQEQANNAAKMATRPGGVIGEARVYKISEVSFFKGQQEWYNG